MAQIFSSLEMGTGGNRGSGVSMPSSCSFPVSLSSGEREVVRHRLGWAHAGSKQVIHRIIGAGGASAVDQVVHRVMTAGCGIRG
jgi:hypothetical protein